MEHSTRDSALVTEETTPSERVIDAVAEAENADPIELDPLYTAVDPDALDSVVESQQGNAFVQHASAEVSFDYQGYRVTVAGDGAVDLDAR